MLQHQAISGGIGARLLLCSLLILASFGAVPSKAQGQPVCPGLQQGVCTAACQSATCSALAGLFKSTFNESRQGLETKSWANQTGWQITRTQSCRQILAAKSSVPSYCSWYGITCCSAEAVAQRQCSGVNTVVELKVQVNGVNGSTEDPAVIQSVLQLHACGLTRLNLEGNDLSGSIGSDWGRLTNLTVLDLGNNWISGTIPDALRSLTKLTVLSLGTNFLSGPLPAWLGELKALQALSLGASGGENPDGTVGLMGSLPESLADLKDLQLLNLETNALTGTLPPALCQNSKLSILKLRANSFIGSPDQLLNCTELTQLDISSNKFSGTLPDSPSGWNWTRLVALDASYNDFEGSIPNALYGLSVLGYLNLGYNRLSGSIQRAITLMQYLTELELNNNQLSGRIDENLWFLPQLSLLDLSNNRLTGTISTAVGLAFSIEEVVLDNNLLHGALPAELGIPKNLRLVDIRQNPAMSCSAAGKSNGGNSSSDGGGVCSANQLLPCFLTFSEATVPRTDGSNMGCPAIIRKPRDEAVQLCSGNGPTQLSDQAANLAETPEGQYELDPTYYSYHGCQCLGEYRPVWNSNNTVMSCVPAGHSMPPWVVPVVVVAAVAAVMLLAASALLVWLRMTVQLRPRWQREKELNENRKKGMPSGGPATIVVTDVESYSDLMQVNAPLTTKAMGIHNAILRKAVAAHAGHVVEQEGDSWSVAFHTPMDAVAFCLQVQQALQKVNWPGDMGAKHRANKSFLGGNAASATAADGSFRGDSSHRGSATSAVNSLTAAFGSAGVLGQGNLRTNSWSQQLQACRAGSGASSDLASGSQAVTPAAAAAQPGIALTSRASRETRSGNLGLMFDTLVEDDKEGVTKTSAVAAAAGGSVDNLMMLGAKKGNGMPDIQPSALSADGLTGTLATKRNTWSFVPRSKVSFSTAREYPQQQQQQVHSQELAPRQASFSSMQSTPKSFMAVERTSTELTTAGAGGSSSMNSTPNNSIQNMLNSLRNRIKHGGSNAGSSSDMQVESLSGYPAAGAAADSSDKLSATALHDAAPAGKPDASGFSGLSRHQTSGSLGAGSLAANLGGPSTSGPSRQPNSSRFWSMLGLPAKEKSSHHGVASDGVIRGLRVRMGVATGWVPRSTNIARCALFELTKAVSDMANGGQVLLEANTFEVVRNRLTELGTVDHRGYNDKLRASASRAVMKQQTSCIFSCLGCVRGWLGLPTDSSTHDTDALLLDMGEYFLPTLAPVIPAAAGGDATSITELPSPSAASVLVPAAAAPAIAAAATGSKDPEAAAAQVVQLRDHTAVAAAAAETGVADAGVSVAAAAVMASSTVPDISNMSLQLYSILPRSLHVRAKLWLSTLTFREGTQQMVKSYFDAPGTGVADLSSANVSASYSDFDRPPLPAVTMVFAAVEGGKSLVRKKPEVGRVVHNALGRIMQMLLMAMPERDGRQDGYLCRQQEGVLKYMLAFREPARAVEWALLMQEVLLYVPWPDEVLQELGPSPAGAAGAADGDGSPKAAGAAAAGWRLSMKIGLAEGPPDSIEPDHLGRPDYFGTFVNLAARMMDAAAQGGQVVASVELAERIYSTWRFEAELGLYDLTPEQQQQPPEQQQEQQSEAVGGSQVSLSSPFAAAAPPSFSTDQQQQQQQQSSVGAPSFSKSDVSEFQLPHVKVLETDQSATLDTPRVTAAAAAGGSNIAAPTAAASVAGSHDSSGAAGGIRLSASRARLLKELLNRSAMLLDGPSYPQRLVHISGQHIGTFAFKGCGALDMISFTTDFMPVPNHDPGGSRGGKGMLVLAGTGPVVGLQECPVLLPNVLPTLQQAWSAAAAAAAAVAAAHEQQQEKLLLPRPSFQGPGTKPANFRRSISSAAAFAAASGEMPDGMLRYRAGGGNPLVRSLSSMQNGDKASTVGGSGSWSSGAGPSLPTSRLPSGLNSSASRTSGTGAGPLLSEDLDVEAGGAVTQAALMRRLNVASFSVGQRVTGSTGGSSRWWQQQQQQGEKSDGGQQDSDVKGRDIELAG